jgi:tRNA-splicing endonuclease subunit Sen2
LLTTFSISSIRCIDNAQSDMADLEQIQKPQNGVPPPPRVRTPSKAQQLSKLYSLPAPLRTFPLPNFIPHNPISLFHVLYAWVSQTIQRPSSHPETLYQGWFSVETQSVHITDPKAIRALWEQGFYGKGSLSRSEPSWLDREKRRKGLVAEQTSEEVTRNRRVERQQIKWERARKEREAIDKKLLEERGVRPASEGLVSSEPSNVEETTWVAPVGPLEILALPNSSLELASLEVRCKEESHMGIKVLPLSNGRASGMVMELPTKTDNFLVENDFHAILTDPFSHNNGNGIINGRAKHNGSANGVSHANGSADSPKQTKGQKTVRFSPKVEQNTFLQSEPPSPELAATNLAKLEDPPIIVQDREHLQLTMEEAFFLSYGLGVLAISDQKSKEVISTKDLFTRFRQQSYFPPQGTANSSPDDPFMLSYVVYHHFRSLGWVVRGGTKFSVDYLLYNRGPVFTHAEFAILIFPSYSNPFWSADASKREYVAKMEKRRWSWLHCINRVNSQVKKTLVLVYVEIPPPDDGLLDDGAGISGTLKRYRIREFVLKRWISNRNRD